MPPSLPTHCEIVIAGAGAIGCSVAYHLALLGKRDVLVLERLGVTQGSTWHAAGLVGQLRSSRNLTRMMQHSQRLYAELEARAARDPDAPATGWRGVGSLRVAASAERWLELKRLATMAKSFGFELHLVSPKEAQKLFPPLDLAGIVGAAWVPSDGHVNPADATQAMARGARAGGARIVEGVSVTAIRSEGRRVTGVETTGAGGERGFVACEAFVDAGGMWGGEIAALAGRHVPVGAVEHQYLVTDKIAGLPAALPTFRDPDGRFYVKPEVGGLAFGGWEDAPPPFGRGGIRKDWGPELLPPDFDRFAPLAEAAQARIPALAGAGVKTLVNGPIPISADGEPVMGRAPGLDNLFVCCGFTSGIAAAGGAGQALARWITEGDPGMNLWAFDCLRFGALHCDPQVLYARAQEAYANYYTVAWPAQEQESARGLRLSPLHERLKRAGACFGQKFGWERANWFAAAGSEARDAPGFVRPNWFDRVGAEHRAVRERAGIFDMTSFSKFEIAGPGACAFLQRACCNDMDRPDGTVIYTQMLNPRGGIEADVTVTRLAPDRYYFVTGSAFGVHDRAHLDGALPRDGSVAITEVTDERAVIGLWGPRARDVLSAATSEDVSNAALPYMRAKTVRAAGAHVLALRVTYVGELGWELHVARDAAPALYDALMQAGARHGLVNAGYRAISSLRLEKQYLYWGADITPDYTPLEAGLGFCVSWSKGDFAGRAALERQKREGVTRKLCWFSLPGYAPVWGGEAILRGGRPAGLVTSAGYGYGVGRSILCGYLDRADWDGGDIAVEAFGERHPAERHAKPLYDPARARILA
jgi:4-methylaminobutanoate oxidase (formaldehyde-forming)